MTRRTPRRRPRRPDPVDEAGLLGGLDALAFGTLVFVTATLLIVNVWSVVDTRMAVAAAAREAVRDLVDDPTWNEITAHERARSLAQDILRQHGRTERWADTVQVTVEAAAVRRCEPVTVAVTATAPTIGLPFIGTFTDGGIEVRVEQTEMLDAFRSGLPGAACA